MRNFADILSNLWLVYVIVALAICLVCVGFLIFMRVMEKKKAKEESANIADRSIYIAALGGEENILESSLSGSRIVIKLKDDEIIKPESLIEAGVDSYIKMNKKLTLVVKENTEAVYERIFAKGEKEEVAPMAKEEEPTEKTSEEEKAPEAVLEAPAQEEAPKKEEQDAPLEEAKPEEPKEKPAKKGKAKKADKEEAPKE